MGDMYRKVKSGDPLVIPAPTFNSFIDAAQAHKALQQASGQTDRPAFRQSGIVLVKNTSGGDRLRFDVLGIDSPVITPTDNKDAFKNKVVVSGTTPSESDHLGRFVILLEPLADGKVGMACAAGVVQAKVSVGDDAHGFADIDDGQAGNLVSSPTGSAAILWKESGTGLKWAVVRFDCARGTADDPAVLEPANFEDETAVSDTWDIADQPSGKDGVTVRVQARTAYDDTGDQKLYAFYRDLTFDSRGCLVAATAETRIEIDAPEDC